MPRAKVDRKVPFSTRVSPVTLDQLDRLVRSSSFPNRTAALEAAVARLADDAEEQRKSRVRAVEETAGSIPLNVPPLSVDDAESDYYDWLADRLLGRILGG